MFMRLSTLLFPIVALAAVATAAPGILEVRTLADQCTTGSLQCCKSTIQSTSMSAAILGGLLGIVFTPIQGLVGLSCTPITLVRAGAGTVCTQQPVCCTGNTYSGSINIGCSPINFNS
ncbi:fungal hydrophobin [Paxillus involutus ATCC 200175]|nr:fungal hydrophobin [Paxillus involutus ATCC 200175]